MRPLPRLLALLWPLLGLGGIALATAFVGLGARFLLPVSATAHLVLYATNLLVILPALYVGVPLLLVIQGILLALAWRSRPPRPRAAAL